MQPDRTAVATAVADLLPQLGRFAFLLTGNRVDGDDLVQSTVERALSRHLQCQSINSIEGWVFSIARSIWKNEIRSRAVRRGNGLEATENLPDQSDQSNQENQFLLTQVQRQLLALPTNQREVLYLIDVAGMSYKEAAATLDIPAGTLMSRLARARQTLLANLQGHDSIAIAARASVRPGKLQ